MWSMLSFEIKHRPGLWFMGVESWNNDLWLLKTVRRLGLQFFLCIHGVLSSKYLVFSGFLFVNEYLKVGFVLDG